MKDTLRFIGLWALGTAIYMLAVTAAYLAIGFVVWDMRWAHDIEFMLFRCAITASAIFSLFVTARGFINGDAP